MNSTTIAAADALEDPNFRMQIQGLKDVTAALNGHQSSPVVFSTDAGSVLKKQACSTEQLVEINTVAALLRRNRYSFTDKGTWVVVDDPVHSIIGSNLVSSGTKPVVIRTSKEARAFIGERS
jgi:hypothetical protein